MIYSKSVVFIHAPKTGGMSVTRFLVNVLDDPVVVVAPTSARTHSLEMAATPQAAAKLSHVQGNRHETCTQAAALIQAQGWQMPPMAFSMIRHPADMLLSYYKHMRKPHVWKRMGMSRETLRGVPQMAMTLPFDAFVRIRGYYGRTEDEILDYYRTDVFEQLDIVPLKDIAEYLSQKLSHLPAFSATRLEHRNKSVEPLMRHDIPPETLEYISTTYRRVADLYETAVSNAPWRGS